MAHIPPEHEKYNLLPRSREGGWEVISYPSFLYEIDEVLADIELCPRADPGEARPSLLTPYGYESLGEYLCVIESYRVKYAHHPIAEELSRLSNRIVEMNRIEDWSVLRYTGPVIPDTIFGLTPGRCYYWPTSTSFPFYDGVIDDEEFTSYAYHSLSPDHWEILEDPTRMAAITMAGLRSTFQTAMPTSNRLLKLDELRLLHRLSRYHSNAVFISGVCGCYHCRVIFLPSDITTWINRSREQHTALCPYCGMPAILPSSSVEASGYELNMNLLAQMAKLWFKLPHRIDGSLCWGIPTAMGRLEARLNGMPTPLRVFKDFYPRGEDYTIPFWSIDLDVSDFHSGDVLSVSIPGATFTYNDGDERCELLTTEVGDIHIGFCGYDPGYHGNYEALLHCFELVGFRNEGFFYEIVRDPSSCRRKSRHSTSIPLALCEISEEHFAHELSSHYEDISTALLFVTSFHVC